MVNVLKLKARLKEKNLTQEDASRYLKVNPSTFNKKINDEAGEYLTIDEADKLKKLLDIPKEEVVDYFFCPET